VNTATRLAPWLEGSAPWLAEWVAEENDALEEISSVIRTQADAPFELSPKNLLRIAYGDKFRLGNQAAFSLLSAPSVPPKLLLPFYEQVILPITPYPTRKKFIKEYGLTPEEVTYLYRNGRVLPIIFTNAKEGVRVQITDYLKVLIRERPPILERSSRVFDVLWDLKPKELHEQEELLRAHPAKASHRPVQSVRIHPASRKTEESVISELPSNYRILNCLGFGGLVSEVLTNYEISDAATLLLYYEFFLGSPFTMGLGASPQIRKELLTFASEILPQFERLSKISFQPDSIFPMEIGEFLTDYYDLAFPVDPTMEAIDEAYRDNALVRARKVLIEFDRLVQENKGHEAAQKAKDIEDIFSEALQALVSFDRRTAKVKWALYGVAAGVIGVLGIAQPSVGLLAGLGYKVSEIEMGDVATAELARIHFNPLAAAIWKFQREFRSVEALKDARKRLRKRKLQPKC
jgi:hypothetical protein